MKNEILVVARMKSAIADAIFGFASDEMRSDLLSPQSGISSRSDFIPPQRDFTRRQRRISLQKRHLLILLEHKNVFPSKFR